jgi:hypothetical protein
MAVTPLSFDTGLSPLPDIGLLSYNNVQFSPLFKSRLHGQNVPDEGRRTIKYVQWRLEVEGIVTLASDAAGSTTDSVMDELRTRLNAQGGTLIYEGRGFGRTIVNFPGYSTMDGKSQDAAWGPIPEILDFQTLGAGRGALITWAVTFALPERPPQSVTEIAGGGASRDRTLKTGPLIAPLTGPGTFPGPVLQFNEESSVSFDEEHYATLAIHGTLEVPLSRSTINTRTSTKTVDDYRRYFMEKVVQFIDLTRFRIVRRTFQHSRDRRTMNWEFQLEEIPPMGDPPGATNARGTFSVRPMQGGNDTMLAGNMQWVCSQRCTYVIRKDWPRRFAWFAFAYLLWWRMQQSRAGLIPSGIVSGTAAVFSPTARVAAITKPGAGAELTFDASSSDRSLDSYRRFMTQANKTKAPDGDPKAWLLHLAFDEGVHRDSRTVSFEASWLLMTTFALVLQASGLWTWDKNAIGGNTWKTSIRDISGWRSVTVNQIDPSSDVIVDFGGGA